MRKFIGVLLSVCILSGTAHAVDLGPGPSSEILSAIESVAAGFYAGKTLRDISPGNSNDDFTIGFNMCNVYAMNMDLDENHFEGVADVAGFIVLTRAQLASPELRAAAKPYLQRLEALAVDRLDEIRRPQHTLNNDFYLQKNSIWESLAAALNKASVSSGTSPGDRYGMQECGGGEIHVRLITRPPSAKVYVIKLFDYALCDVRHIDHSDKERCFGWMPNAPDVLGMSGWYQYQAIWPDGKVTAGRFAITDVDEDKPFVLTLSR